MTEKRIAWPTYFMLQAVMLASRGTCTRLQVGAVIVKDGRIIASGYNGSVSGTPHCDEVGDLMVDGHCIRAVHAEQNALMQTAQMGISINNATIYVTDVPCIQCTKLLLQAGVQEIKYLRNYHNDDFAKELLLQKNVPLTQVPLTQETVDQINLTQFITKGL